ncbi:uncharacterized protein PpBr36_10996 [Pyricularia pennisetigena]|uniref:uncharacterized protein n=1 Tax=Pyricularia pennisetigena TaxID=1578925 RepID=UPI00114F883C|nr:uncharacterized protein PpBr36_10996 [Pyricularia pennisetigena]TLS20665.1 hypothetical protein PpBr36_10996 [Pyricularia pennisetigena]
MTATNEQVLDHNHLLAAVMELGIDRSAPFVDSEFSGGQCKIFKISFRDNDSESLAVRVPLHSSASGLNDGLIDMIRAEWEILQKLEKKGFAWAPRCRSCSLTFDNLIKLPFLVYTWAHGSSPIWTEEVPSRPLRDKLLRQLAKIQVALIQSTLETRNPMSKMEGFPSSVSRIASINRPYCLESSVHSRMMRLLL